MKSDGDGDGEGGTLWTFQCVGVGGHEKVFCKQDREREVEEIRNQWIAHRRRNLRGLQSPAGSR